MKYIYSLIENGKEIYSDTEQENVLHELKLRKGLQDSKDLVKRFEDIKIDAFYSSPYVRAVDTIKPLDSAFPNVWPTRSFISRAALLVNVTAAILRAL